MKAFKKNSRDQFSKMKDSPVELGNLQKIYLEEIYERLNLLQFLINIIMGPTYSSSSESEASSSKPSALTFKYEFLSLLWDLLVTEALIPAEKDLLFKWLKEFCESKNNNYLQEITKFYKDKVIAQNEEVEEMTKEGFNCLKALFCSINTNQNGLIKQSKVNIIY